MRRGRGGRWLAIIAAGLGVVATGCTGGSSHPSAGPAGGGQPTQIPAGEHTASKVVELGGGARVIFADEPAPNSRLLVQTAAAPILGMGQSSLATPVKLTMIGGSLGRGATLEFPLPHGSSDGAAVGIATYSEQLHRWTPVKTEIDRSRGVLRTFTNHFSWWQPWTWDWYAIGARINQNVGQVLGKRAGEPACHRGQPAPGWVAQLVGVTQNAGLVVRSCAEGEGNVLAVELVNNRPYGQILTYGSGVKWGWHEAGSSDLDKAANQAMDSLVGGGALYLPPKGRASVGVLPVSSNKVADFYIGPTAASLFVDMLKVVAGTVMTKVGKRLGAPLLAACGSAAVTNVPLTKVGSAEAVWAVILGSISCGKQAFLRLAKEGVITVASRDELLATLEAMKSASRVGLIIKAYDVEWKLLDLVVDGSIADAPANLGNGFAVRAKAEPTSPPRQAPSPGPGSPLPHPRAPTPQPPASAQPPPPPTERAVTVFNQVTNGMGMREDTPAYLSKVTQNYCRTNGCMVPDTFVGTGVRLTAVCQTTGARTTNGNDHDPADDANPQRFESTRWYGIRWPDGRFGYISEVWIDAADRGGLGLRAC